MDLQIMSFKEKGEKLFNYQNQRFGSPALSPSDIPKKIELFINESQIEFFYSINESKHDLVGFSDKSVKITYSKRTGRIYLINDMSNFNNWVSISKALHSIRSSNNFSGRSRLNFKIGMDIFEHIAKNIGSLIRGDEEKNTTIA